MEQHLHAIHIKTEEDRQAHLSVLQHGANELYATQQRILANEAHAAKFAQQAATAAAVAASRIEYLLQEAARQQLVHEDTNRRLAQTQSAITTSHLTNAARIDDTQNALIYNAQTTQAHVAQVAASTSQSFAVVHHQAQASASATQATVAASDMKHISATDAIFLRITAPLAANDKAVRESQEASTAALLAQQNVISTAATLQKVLDKQPTRPSNVTGPGVLSTLDNGVDSLNEWEKTQPHLAHPIPPYDGDRPKVYGHPKGRQFIDGTWKNPEQPSTNRYAGNGYYTEQPKHDRSRSPPRDRSTKRSSSPKRTRQDPPPSDPDDSPDDNGPPNPNQGRWWRPHDNDMTPSHDPVQAYKLVEKAESLLSHIATYSGHE